MEAYIHDIAEFVRQHEAWAAPVVLALAFGESLAFVSLLIPAWGALVAIGALIGVSGLSFWPVWIAGGVGAALGDWVSYWFGYRYKDNVAQIWPLSKYPGLLRRGEDFVRKWGVPSIFIGRFFGPLRASVPLAAESSRCHSGRSRSPMWCRPWCGRRCCCCSETVCRSGSAGCCGRSDVADQMRVMT